MTAAGASGPHPRGSGNLDFYVSYAESDQEWAEWIAWELESAGYSVRIACWDHALPGANEIYESHRDLASAERLIAVLSPAYDVSSRTPGQWTSFLARDPESTKRLVIPVEVAPVETAGLIGNLTPVSLVGLSPEDARDRLLQGVRETRLKPSRPPGYPGRPAPAFPAARRAPRLRWDTKLLFATLAAVAGFCVYSWAVYQANPDPADTGNQWRAVIALVLFAVFGRMCRGWVGRRLRGH